MIDSYVLVIGAASIDIKGRPLRELQRGTSAHGRIRTSVGGVARNIAENLSRLGVPTVLLSAVGNDRSGQRVVSQALEAGIDISHLLVEPTGNTGAYLALMDETGSLTFGLDDMRIANSIRPNYVYRHRRLFRDASMVVVDANLPPETLETVFRLAQRYQIPICADPTSAPLANRLRPYLPDLLLITPNMREAEVLSGQNLPQQDRDAALSMAKLLVSRGVEIAIITMAELGLCYATLDESGHVPAVRTEIVDLTGAGDALTAGVIFALLNDIHVSEAVRLGCSAASLTIACDHTVVPDLTLEMLYDNLSA